jgi:hypothetical protein
MSMNVKVMMLAAIWAILAGANEVEAQDTLHVLFVGNSYTYTNDLPSLFLNLAASGGNRVVTAMSAPGGYTLEQHTTNPTTLDLIAQGGWDYVVLQEQSQYPTIPYYRLNSMYPSARWLDSMIVAHGERTAFFMTWGRKHGGQQVINGYYSYPFANFFEMQDTLTAAYTEISQELAATLCPIGLCWARAVELDSTVDLWQADGSHPTLQGSYLATCSFYATLYGASPVGLPYTGGLTPSEAAFLQYAAWNATFATAGTVPPIRLSNFTLTVSPNPFNLTSTVGFELQVAHEVQLTVFEMSGRLITTLVDGWRAPGTHEVTFEGSGLASGLYFVRMQVGNYRTGQKVMLLK